MNHQLYCFYNESVRVFLMFMKLYHRLRIFFDPVTSQANFEHLPDFCYPLLKFFCRARISPNLVQMGLFNVKVFFIKCQPLFYAFLLGS